MTLREKREIKPLLVKFGMALALSFAGFLYSRLRTKRTRSSLPPPPPSPHSSDRGSEVPIGGKTRRNDDIHALNSPNAYCSLVSIPAERNEENYIQKVTVENSMLGLSPSSRHSGDNNGLLLPEFNDLVKEIDFASTNIGSSPRKDVESPRSDVETPRAARSLEKDDFEQEVRNLRNMVRMLRERERTLEVQLLEYYGLKEQETAVMELQNRLKINNMEAKLFALKIESLQADNRRLEAQVADHAKIVAELDAARSKVKLLKKKLRSESEQNKEQILDLRKRVAKLQEQEYNDAAANDQDTQSRLQRLKVLESEAENLRKANMRLQVENSEMSRRLESTQILANSLLSDPEREKLKEMNDRLRQENDSLAKEIEQLQADRCADAEELVYLKWVNACLRYELRNYQPPAGKTVARDLSKTLSPRSEEKAKQLILEYSNTDGVGNIIDDCSFDRWSSSQASYITDSENPDDSSFDNSSATKTNNSSRAKLFRKLRKLIQGKEGHHHNQVSSGYKTGSCEDSDSPRCSSSMSTGINAAFEVQSSRLASPSQTNSDAGSSSGYKKFVLRKESASDLPLENQLDQDADLLKFAEVLKGSRGRRGRLQRNAASFSFG